jgi:hypothetical protein
MLRGFYKLKALHACLLQLSPSTGRAGTYQEQLQQQHQQKQQVLLGLWFPGA